MSSQTSLHKTSIFKPQRQPCLSSRGDFPPDSCVIIYIFWLFGHSDLCCECPDQRLRTDKMTEQVVTLVGAVLGSAWWGSPGGGRDEWRRDHWECRGAFCPAPLRGLCWLPQSHCEAPLAMALTFVAVARWGAGCGHSTPVAPGLCLVLIASFLPTNEKTEDSEHNTSFYFRFSSFIPKTFSYLVQLTFSPQRRKEGTDFFFFLNHGRKEKERTYL